jgi:hypothetical protein
MDVKKPDAVKITNEDISEILIYYGKYPDNA